MSCMRLNVTSPEFGEALLVVGTDGEANVFRLVDIETQQTLAIGEEVVVDCVDSTVHRDSDYLYLTSYCFGPVQTVRVELNGRF